MGRTPTAPRAVTFDVWYTLVYLAPEEEEGYVTSLVDAAGDSAAELAGRTSRPPGTEPRRGPPGVPARVRAGGVAVPPRGHVHAGPADPGRRGPIGPTRSAGRVPFVASRSWWTASRSAPLPVPVSRSDASGRRVPSRCRFEHRRGARPGPPEGPAQVRVRGADPGVGVERPAPLDQARAGTVPMVSAAPPGPAVPGYPCGGRMVGRGGGPSGGVPGVCAVPRPRLL